METMSRTRSTCLAVRPVPVPFYLAGASSSRARGLDFNDRIRMLRNQNPQNVQNYTIVENEKARTRSVFCKHKLAGFFR